MKKYSFSVAERVAVWRGWKKRCVYTGEPVRFADLQIDHLIPEEVLSHPQELSELTTRLGLSADFAVNSFWNWVPTFHLNNQQKGARKFSDSSLRFYLELAARHYPAVVSEYERQRVEERSERHLAALAKLVEHGSITLQEIIDFVTTNARQIPTQNSEPLVITLGVGPEVFDDAVFYGPTCDALEDQLFRTLRAKVRGLVQQTEASERTGESLSVRFAVWHVPLEALLAVIDEPWDLLEVAPFHDIYPNADASSLYAEALATKRQDS